MIEKISNIERDLAKLSTLPMLIERMLEMHSQGVPIRIVYMIVGATFMGFAGGAGIKIIADYFKLIHNVP